MQNANKPKKRSPQTPKWLKTTKGWFKAVKQVFSDAAEPTVEVVIYVLLVDGCVRLMLTHGSAWFV